ncbi:MAG: DUF3516 domain-containing protein, partial [Verrucomicrobiaceae bacterium]
DPNYKPGESDDKPEQAPDVTRNKREFTALIRTEIFRFLRPLAQENYAAAVASLGASAWKADALAAALDPYFEAHERIRLDPEARNGRHTYVDATPTSWRVSQVLVDPEELNDWQAQFTVDVAQAREDGKPTLVLLSVAPVVE